MSEDWWLKYDNITTLVRWMSDNGYDALEVVYAIEKPWHYTEEYRKATQSAAQK